MNTRQHAHRLETGQALEIPRRSAKPAILSEGELVVQTPAHWLAETVVLPTPVRLVAPALLPASACSLVAVRPSSVVVLEASPFMFHEKLRASTAWLRGMLRRWAG